MKFIVDAQLPRRLARLIEAAGHDALHTLDLPDGNRTTDGDINSLSIQEKMVVVTKDADFVDSYLLTKKPFKLLLVSVGNISNKELESLFAPLVPNIVASFTTHDFVELTRTALIVHV